MKIQRHTLILCLTCASFAVATNLAFYSDNRIAMNFGSGGESWFHLATLWAGMLLQPWVLGAFALEAALGFHVISTSAGAAVVTGLCSAVVLVWLLRRVLQRFPKAEWVVVVMLLAIAIHAGWIHHQQMERLENITSSGPP